MAAQQTFSFTLAEHGERWADPVQIRRDLLIISRGQLWDWVAEARSLQDAMAAPDQKPSVEAEIRLAELEGQLVGVAYQAFALTPVDPATGIGITETEMAAILKSYLEYSEKKG